MTGCNPLVVPAWPEGAWQVWCKPHRWEGPVRDHLWQARRDKDEHLGVDADADIIPMWARGPGMSPP